MKMRNYLLILIVIFALAGTAFALDTNSTSQSGAIAIADSAGYLQQGNTSTYLLQIIPGVVGDITRSPNFPEFAGIKKLNNTTIILDLRVGVMVPYEYFDKLLANGVPLAVIAPDKIVKQVAYTRGGRWFGFTRLEDLQTDVIDCIPKALSSLGMADATNLRLSGTFKMSSKTIGMNLGGSGQGAGFGGGANPVAWGGGINSVAGFVVNTADPKFQLYYSNVIAGAVTLFNVTQPKVIEVVKVVEKPVIVEKIVETVRVINLEDVHFDNDKDTLTAEAKSILDRDIKALKDNPTVTSKIIGYCSALGTEKYNLRLSERRAKNVEKYLVSNGISASKLTTVGYGKANPVMVEANPKDINTEAAKANRRVIFEINVK